MPASSLEADHGSIVVAAVDGQMSRKRPVIDGTVPGFAFRNPDPHAFAFEELGEGVIWDVVRVSVRWHVARGQRA
ncbi:hypothetical protein R1A27_09390 [Methylobacterium sp. NMS12]|uniref:hypothetical protein n=1 Tax=Methylobacterium sp. NMS12 TaxID=3079766 RepID=UPI003F884272